MPPVLTAVAAGVGAFALGASVVGGVLVGLSVFHQLRQRDRLARGRRQRATQTIRASVEPIKWRIGITRCFGMLSQIAWSGRRIQYTLVIGEAPINGVSRIWVGGRGIDVNIVDTGSVSLSADQALGEGGSGMALKIDFFLTGAALSETTRAPMVADPWDDAEGLRWDSEMTMEGLAFAVVYAIQNQDGSWWRAIPEIEFRTTGYKWAPPGETAAVITNAAQVRRWWEIEREREPLERIDAISYQAAVTVCTAANYEINGTVESVDSPEQTRADFDLAWDGTVVDFGGTLKFLPGVVRPQILVIPEDDILDLPTIRPSPELHERVNRVTMRLSQSRIADHLEHSMPPVNDETAQRRDDGVLTHDYGIVEYITDPTVGTRTGNRQMLETAGMRVELRVPYGTDTAPFRYLALVPGSIVGIGRPEFSGRRFRLDATGPGEEDTLTLRLSEELPTRYTATGLTVDPPVIPEVEPPSTTDLAAPTSLTLTFTSLLTRGTVVTRVTGGGGTVGEDGGTIPAPTVKSGEMVVESERMAVVTWSGLMADDPAVGWRLQFHDALNTPDHDLLASVALEPEETEWRYPYHPSSTYTVTLRRILPPRRLGKTATISATAPVNRTHFPPN